MPNGKSKRNRITLMLRLVKSSNHSKIGLVKKSTFAIKRKKKVTKIDSQNVHCKIPTKVIFPKITSGIVKDKLIKKPSIQFRKREGMISDRLRLPISSTQLKADTSSRKSSPTLNITPIQKRNPIVFKKEYFLIFQKYKSEPRLKI